jgi:Ca2+-binding EF-hand superfamily protein
VENVFKNFDEDGSGTIDIKELFGMFNDNGIPITMKKI